MKRETEEAESVARISQPCKLNDWCKRGPGQGQEGGRGKPEHSKNVGTKQAHDPGHLGCDGESFVRTGAESTRKITYNCPEGTPRVDHAG